MARLVDALAVSIALALFFPSAGALAAEPVASPEPQDLEGLVASLLDFGDDVAGMPCLSVSTTPASSELDANTYLGEQTTGVELNGALPVGDGVNAIVIAYPVACRTWAEDLVGVEPDANDVEELLADLLP